LEFIPLAEETGLIVPIGRWVLQEATRQAAVWQHRSPLGRLRMSVNVSVRQFQHPDLVGDVADALRVSGLAPSLLTLEITESLFVHDTEETTRKIGQLKDLGVRLALDDFGTGYSSLSYLRRFPIDTLKIDKSFIDGVTTSAEGHAVVAAITQLGENLHLEVVAEGLETGEQVEVLAALGCPLGQGYHFSKPLGAGDAVKLLLTGRKSDPQMLVPA
jgi:EAL domain-containing protein (putative c-di-GMP-specific phosphodiesterase class I)